VTNTKYITVNFINRKSRTRIISFRIQLQPAGRPDHDQQHCYHHAPTVKPEAATAVVELLMMSVKTPETC
jgi:hypothetical protein